MTAGWLILGFFWLGFCLGFLIGFGRGVREREHDPDPNPMPGCYVPPRAAATAGTYEAPVPERFHFNAEGGIVED